MVEFCATNEGGQVVTSTCRAYGQQLFQCFIIIITPEDFSEISFREGRKGKNNPFLALFLFENTCWVLGLRQYIKLLSFPSTVDIVKTISSWELTLKFAGLLGSTGLYVNVPPRKWLQTESCTCTRHIKRAIYISNSFILMQSWSACWSTLFA